MARQKYLPNTNAGLTGCIRAVATEDMDKGTIVPFYGEGKDGDILHLTKSGKWGTKKTKTSKPVGRLIIGAGEELAALIAPQGQY